MNDMIYIPADIRDYWNTRGGREAMIEFLRHAPKIFTKYVDPKTALHIYIEDKPILSKLILETL